MPNDPGRKLPEKLDFVVRLLVPFANPGNPVVMRGSQPDGRFRRKADRISRRTGISKCGRCVSIACCCLHSRLASSCRSRCHAVRRLAKHIRKSFRRAARVGAGLG